MTGTGRAWEMLSALPAWEMTEVPRPSGDQPGASVADLEADLRVQALASAYGTGEPVAVAWLRDQAGGPVRVIAAGSGLAGGDDSGEMVLTLPPGARGVPLGDGEAARALAGLPCWTRIGGVTDALLAGTRPEQSSGGQRAAPSLENGLLSAWLGAFAWLVFAEPVPEKMINDLAAEAAHQQLTAEGNGSPRSRLAARRAAARHEELREAVSAGLWRVHLLAAGGTPAAAARVARLVCTSADLRDLPYALSVRQSAGSFPDMLAADTPLPRPRRPAQQRDAGASSRLDVPMSEQWQSRGGGQQWPSTEWAPDPAAVARLADDERDTPVPESPFTASTRLLAVLARVPAREVPGLRFRLRPEFDVTPEAAGRHVAEDGGSVAAGVVLDGNRFPAGPLALPLASLNRHVFVCGATGAGKSQTVRHLLEQAAHAGIPWLVVEPAKAEYRLMAARLPGTEVIRIRPGDLGQPAAGINPLEPASGPDGRRFPLQTHADLLRALFLAAFQADEPFPQVLSAALSRCYEQAGWDLVTGQPVSGQVQPAYPGLEDLQSAAMAVVDEIGYGREVADNVRGFVTVRIGSLRLGTTGRFLDGGHPLDFAALLDANVVLEIEDAGDDHDKAFVMGAVLIRLTEYLRLRSRAEPVGQVRLRHLTVIEEAHRLLRQPPPGTGTGPAAQAVEMFADLLAEVRAYGEGLIIAEQIPAKLIPDTIKNTAVKIVHRLPALDDRQVVGATMNLRPGQSEYLVTLVPGEAAVHADGMDYPLLARMPDGTAAEAAPAVTVSPGPVIGRRSLTCGPDCTTEPCTLGQMRAAQRACAIDSRLTLWAELTVVAHLTGWEMPRPSPAFTTALHATGTRLRDCALSHAVSTAVAARVTAISTRVSPAGLAAHMVTAMRQIVSDGTPGCASEEPEYLAPPWRWALVRGTLRTAAPEGGRHPRSAEWEHAYDEPVPGTTAAQQLRVINRRYARDQRDTRSMHTVIWGSRPCPAIEQAIGAHAGSDDWPARLADALTAFARISWARKMLTRPDAARTGHDGKQAASE